MVQLGKKRNLWLFFLGGMLFLGGCTSDSNTTTKEQSRTPTLDSQPKVVAPDFNSENAYNYIKAQVDFGPRVPNSKAHGACVDYLRSVLEGFGLQTQIQKGVVMSYDRKKLHIKNICARWMPDLKKRIVLFAHYDTRHIADRDVQNTDKPILGANDGASGVGVILGVLESIIQAQIKPKVGIDLVFFDAEDYGQPSSAQGPKEDTWALGAQYWSRNKSFGSAYSPNAGILLDMVGAKDARFPKEGHSMRYAKNIVEDVWKTAAQLGYAGYFTSEIEPYGITDDHKYVNEIAKIPTIDIIHYDVQKRDFGSFHHTHNDNMDVIHKPTLKAVGQTVLQYIYNQ